MLFSMPGQLDGKIALITGASRGIGQGIAEAFAEQGATLILIARGRERLDRIAGELSGKGAQVASLPADVTDEEKVREAFDVVRRRFGRLDILVNNAGEARSAPIDQLTTGDWDD